MDISYKGIYYDILEEGSVSFDDMPYYYDPKWEEVTREEVLEILQTHFKVDFGYDVKKWEQYIEENGGWDFHYWEKGMLEIELKILEKYGK